MGLAAEQEPEAARHAGRRPQQGTDPGPELLEVLGPGRHRPLGPVVAPGGREQAGLGSRPRVGVEADGDVVGHPLHRPAGGHHGLLGRVAVDSGTRGEGVGVGPGHVEDAAVAVRLQRAQLDPPGHRVAQLLDRRVGRLARHQDVADGGEPVAQLCPPLAWRGEQLVPLVAQSPGAAHQRSSLGPRLHAQVVGIGACHDVGPVRGRPLGGSPVHRCRLPVERRLWVVAVRVAPRRPRSGIARPGVDRTSVIHLVMAPPRADRLGDAPRRTDRPRTDQLGLGGPVGDVLGPSGAVPPAVGVAPVRIGIPASDSHRDADLQGGRRCRDERDDRAGICPATASVEPRPPLSRCCRSGRRRLPRQAP